MREEAQQAREGLDTRGASEMAGQTQGLSVEGAGMTDER
jgi:hypothetical protein